MIRFKLLNENETFGKLVFAIQNMTSFQYLNTFLGRLVVILMNVILILCNEMPQSNIQKISITQHASISKMAKQCATKLYMCKVSI